ncbi:HupE/UreJ family protein [Alteromonas sp. A079]|uniref:HupE/UreJ family protein n=1 Tax=Alteromonas sp. A079 TaxID=3410268 RepID=UPI003BA210C5
MKSLLFLLLIALSFSSKAHELSNGYLTLSQTNDTTLSGELLLKPKELALTTRIDSNDNGQLTWGEVTQAQPAVSQYLMNALTFSRGEKACSMMLSSPSMRDVSAESLLVYPLTVTCENTGALLIHYDGIFSHFPSHKLLLTVSLLETSSTKVLTKNDKTMLVSIDTPSLVSLFFNLLYEGVWHIFIGIDHILFLVATLLTVNLHRDGKAWAKQQSVRTIIKNTVILVSAFTLAHSITLTATALGAITLSSRIVELGIAISVLLTAINNIYPVILRLGIVTFGFGLLHGMGFASVFADLNAQANNLVLSVAAFNIGVELGQLAIVAGLLPLLVLLRNWKTYSITIMPFASSVIAIIALNWTIQRW